MRRALFVIAVWGVLGFGVGGCRSEIRHGLDERQANEVQAALTERGIEAEKVMPEGSRQGWTVRVRRERSAEATQALSELGLPRQRAQGFTEVFGKGSLVPTPSEERALYLQALSGELAQTLESVDEVLSARVHLVLPTHTRETSAPPGPKASALLRVRAGKGPRVAQRREELQALVAGGVEGLRPEAVTLVVQEAETAAPPTRLTRQRSSEGGWKTTVLGALVFILSVSMICLFVYRGRTAARLEKVG